MNNLTLKSLAMLIFEVITLVLLVVNLSLFQTLLMLFINARQTWTTQLILAISLRRFIFLYL